MQLKMFSYNSEEQSSLITFANKFLVKYSSSFGIEHLLWMTYWYLYLLAYGLDFRPSTHSPFSLLSSTAYPAQVWSLLPLLLQYILPWWFLLHLDVTTPSNQDLAVRYFDGTWSKDLFMFFFKFLFLYVLETHQQ